MPDNEEISILSYAHCDNILVRCERATSNRYVALTCAEYLTMPPAQSAEFSAHEELNMLDFGYVERNRKVVGNYCKKHCSAPALSIDCH